MHLRKAVILFAIWLLSVVGCLCLCAASPKGRIRRVVVFMEENRSFDHVFGFRKGVNGLTGSEFNFVDPLRPEKGKVFVSETAPDVALCDPDHDLPPTTVKIFGLEATKASNFSRPSMEGFVEFEYYARGENATTNYCGVMEALSRARTPVLNALADEFVLMDEFFASVPGPTWPNRMFFLSGTSAGQTETDNPWFQGIVGQLFPQRTIFDQLEDAGLSWKNYVGDGPWELFLDSVASHPDRIVPVETFYEDAAAGTLPAFAYVSPRAGMSFDTGECANDMHPDHSIAEGELLVKRVYEALVRSPLWNETLFVVTFDEHGGFYDHVPPPNDVPAPDAYPSFPDSFDFKRLGVRIPTLLISPWVKRGAVLGAPPAEMRPTPSSAYELTSIISTMRRLFGAAYGNTTPGALLSPLTARDAWAATFDHVLSLDTARDDCPLVLPEPAPRPHYTGPEGPNHHLHLEAQRPVNGLQKHIGSVLAELTGITFTPMKQHEVSPWLLRALDAYRGDASGRRASQPDAAVTGAQSDVGGWSSRALSLPPTASFEVRCQSFIDVPNAAGSWTILGNVSFGAAVRLQAKMHHGSAPSTTPSPATTTSLCLTYDVPSPVNSAYDASVLPATRTAAVSVTPCTTDGSDDSRQLWCLHSDATVRPLTRPSMCVTSRCAESIEVSSTVAVADCTGVPSLNQRWSVFPTDPDDNFSHDVFLSEGGVWTIVLVAT